MTTKEINRAQAVQTMKVRNLLKGDCSWIHKETDPDKKHGKPRPKKLSEYAIQKSVEESMNAAVPEEISVVKPVAVPAGEPVVKPVAGAAGEPVVKPVAGAAGEPVVRPIAVAAGEPVVKPVAVAAGVPVVKPVVMAANEPVAKSVAVAAGESVVKPVAVAAGEPVVKPVAAVGASVQPVIKPAEGVQTVVKSEAAVGTTVRPIVQPGAAAADQVAVQPVVQPVEKTSADIVKEATGESAGKLRAVPQSVEVVQKSSAAIELEEALDMEPVKPPADKDDVMAPATEPTPHQGPCPSLIQPQKDSEQHHHQIVHELRHTKDGDAICSYCNKSIVGNVKITVNDPPIYSHLDCFKCGVCSKPLGDMMTAMYHRGRRIHCHYCFTKN